MPSVRVIQEVAKIQQNRQQRGPVRHTPPAATRHLDPRYVLSCKSFPLQDCIRRRTFFTRQTLSTPLVFRREKTTTRWKVTINYPRENQTGSHRDHQIGLKRKEKGVFLLMSTTITIKRKLRNCSRCAVRVCVGTNSSQIKICLC
jgi:hypothetical protein